MRRLLLLVAVLGAAAAGSPLSAVTRYVAIGDSIVAGTSWPEDDCGGPCPAVFDCSGGCDFSPSQAVRDECGFVRRLEDWLGAGHDVRNRGVGGESTMDAVMRFATEMDAECGTPGDCNAVLLKHGTNDMFFSVSPETARNNLGVMIDQAKARNIDTLLMTIIRRGYDPNNTKWAAYKDLILALAASKSVQVVNPWQTLCATTNCYNMNYWVIGEEPCLDPTASPDPGHLDPDGYDEITDLIKAAFPAAVPATPATTSPAGAVCDVQPKFVWPAVATARWYELEIDAEPTTTTWWEAAAHCAGGTCTAAPGVVLGAGPHSWRVRGRNLRGLGGWSAATAFDVGVPPAPAAVAPTGELFASAPTYEWLAIGCATGYDLEVRDALGNLEQQATGLSPAAVCAGGRCVYQGTTISDPDDYTLKVLARNTIGDGPLSSPGAEFTILACANPSLADLATLEPSPVTTTKTVEHCGPIRAAEAMGATYIVSPGGNLTIHTRDGFTAYSGFRVEGRLTVQTP